MLNALEINWSAEDQLCRSCCDGQPPTAGSYASTLCHFERALDEQLPGPRTGARILMLFQDPRSGEDNFRSAPPDTDPADLLAGEHRYFCLTKLAWATLNLGLGEHPRWPVAETAHLFLRRYLGRGPKAWSYDGFIAYFLALLRPADAYVTNVAKCYFSEQTASVYDTCVRRHLAREVAVFSPNVILSFTAKLTDAHIAQLALPQSCAVLRLYHPAARGRVSASRKVQSFVDEVDVNAVLLGRLGINPKDLTTAWLEHARRCLGP